MQDLNKKKTRKVKRQNGEDDGENICEKIKNKKDWELSKLEKK